MVWVMHAARFPSETNAIYTGDVIGDGDGA